MAKVESRALLVTCAAIVALGAASPASAYTFNVIYNFTGGADGGVPPYTLLANKKGEFTGTASSGGQDGNGIVST